MMYINSNLRLYYNQMSGFQASIYQNFVNSLNPDILQISEQRMGIQISNIVYPDVNVK